MSCSAASVPANRRGGGLARRLNRIAEECAAPRDVDPRSPYEIIGDDEDGAPRR